MPCEPELFILMKQQGIPWKCILLQWLESPWNSNWSTRPDSEVVSFSSVSSPRVPPLSVSSWWDTKYHRSSSTAVKFLYRHIEHYVGDEHFKFGLLTWLKHRRHGQCLQQRRSGVCLCLAALLPILFHRTFRTPNPSSRFPSRLFTSLSLSCLHSLANISGET